MSPIRCRCGRQFSSARARLGYKTCLVCGDRLAAKKERELRQQTAPAYNKGPYMLITSRDVASLGRKDEEV